MSTSDPHPSRSKEKTAPRRGTPAPLPPAPEKKPEKKIDTSVLVAIISAVITLVTAILGSPVVLALVNRTPTAPPSMAELGLFQSTLFPTTPTEGDLSKATFTPTGNNPFASGSTETPAGANPTLTNPALEATLPATIPSSVQENTSSPTPAASFFQCIADVWFPYPATLNPGISDGCWNLAEWGFTTDQGQLLLIHNPSQDQQRGIYLPIFGDVDIHFVIQMNEFRVRGNKGAFLHFGIVQNDPFSNFAGGFLSYQQPSPGEASPIRVLVSGNNQATQNVMTLEAGFQQEILLSIEGDLMTVFIDGQPAGDPVGLTPTDRAFWIGYVLPAKGEIDLSVSNFTVEAR